MFIILVWVISWTVGSASSIWCLSKTHIWWDRWLCYSLSFSHSLSLTSAGHWNEAPSPESLKSWLCIYLRFSSAHSSWTLNTRMILTKLLGLAFFLLRSFPNEVKPRYSSPWCSLCILMQRTEEVLMLMYHQWLDLTDIRETDHKFCGCYRKWNSDIENLKSF